MVSVLKSSYRKVGRGSAFVGFYYPPALRVALHREDEVPSADAVKVELFALVRHIDRHGIIQMIAPVIGNSWWMSMLSEEPTSVPLR